ncbi:MAG: putative addiction module antidote protein [Spiribacter sp.]|jgi:probable addiction module antidote protein|nr:putative addiction module antidote protein [Spiribacter sp.]
MTKLTEYNPFDHLLGENELAQYLTDAYEDDDPAVFVVALGHAIKHKGVAQIAEAAGLNRESLYKVINGQVQPKWDTIHRLMHALGVHLSVAA